MKHLKLYQSFLSVQSKEEIDAICKKYSITNYTINDGGSVDVDGDVNLTERELTKLPLKFRRVTGKFYCGYNYLNSLKGSPNYVGRGFYCHNNYLTSFEGCPTQVRPVIKSCRITGLIFSFVIFPILNSLIIVYQNILIRHNIYKTKHL